MTFIGICMNTHERADTAVKVWAEIVRYAPEGARLVVVDDATAVPAEFPGAETVYRFSENVGVARAKNKALELLDGCEHLFIFDDDCFPRVADWWKPYVDSPEPHLSYQFADLSGSRKLGDFTRLHEDSRHVAYSGQRGCLLYYDRDCIRAAGGFDTGFERHGYEHPDLANRIYNLGLTTWRFADVKGSEKLIYSMDEHSQITRSVPTSERRAVHPANEQRYLDQYDSTEYREYREQTDWVVSHLLTKTVDPQRGVAMKADSSLLSSLVESLRGENLVVLHDELEDVSTSAVRFERVERSISNPYFDRHLHSYQWLRDHPEVRYVWCVDGTDVEMLKPPWDHMEPDTLYLGSEPNLVGIEWMIKSHGSYFVNKFIRENPSLQLLNAGLIGGSREIVMSFLHDLIACYHDVETRVFLGAESKSVTVGDMGALNYVAYTKYADRLEWGSHINTVFKAYEKPTGDVIPTWRHK